MTALLELDRLTRRFGGITAVDAVSMRVETGEIRGLIGPNGAGKTTTLNLISGLTAPTSGRLMLAGADVTLGLAVATDVMPVPAQMGTMARAPALLAAALAIPVYELELRGLRTLLFPGSRA